MNKLIACLVVVAAISLSAGESQAQFSRGFGGFGGSGISIGIGNGFNSFGRGGFNSFGRSGFNSFSRGGFGGVSVNVGNRGFSPYRGGGFGVPSYSSQSFYRPSYQPVYRSYRPSYGGGGFYGGGGGRSCGGY